MPVERTLPENLDKVAIAWGRAVAGYNNASWHIEAAISAMTIDCGKPLPIPPDASTIMALNIALKCVKADLEGVKRTAEAAEQIA